MALFVVTECIRVFAWSWYPSATNSGVAVNAWAFDTIRHLKPSSPTYLYELILKWIKHEPPANTVSCPLHEVIIVLSRYRTIGWTTAFVRAEISTEISWCCTRDTKNFERWTARATKYGTPSVRFAYYFDVHSDIDGGHNTWYISCKSWLLSEGAWYYSVPYVRPSRRNQR